MKRKDYIFFIIILIVMAILVLNDCIAIPCVFHKFTGLYCPGCGSTRAVKYLLKGNIYLSFRNNMLIYVIFPVVFVLEIAKIRFKKSKRYKRIYNVIIVILLIITIIFGILRNIPMFSILAPLDETFAGRP